MKDEPSIDLRVYKNVPQLFHDSLKVRSLAPFTLMININIIYVVINVLAFKFSKDSRTLGNSAVISENRLNFNQMVKLRENTFLSE